MISLCVPSRGRPERAKLMRESAMDTAKDPDILEKVTNKIKYKEFKNTFYCW